MEKKDGGILLPILYALLGGVGGFLVVLFIGIGIGAFNTQGQVAAQPSAQPSYRGTLPTQKPTRDPVQTPAPEETDGPVETEPDAQTREPSNPPAEPTKAPESTQTPSRQTSPPVSTRAPSRPAQTQNPGPVVSINPTTQPVRPTQAPAQSGGAGTIQNNDGTYTHDFSGGRMLGTINSDKYHCGDCRAAKTIPPENCVWYNSEDEAKADGRSRCGICWR